MTGLNTRSVTELCGLLASGACSSLEIVEDVLAAIEVRDGDIGAYLRVDGEAAREQARAMDARCCIPPDNCCG